jgi:DNA polymerase
VQKDKAGAAFLKLLIKKVAGGYEPTKADIDRLEPYAIRDVEVLRQLDGRIPELDPEDAAIAEMDAVMNQRGMPVDIDLVKRLIVVRDAEDARLTAEIVRLTGGKITTLNQGARLLAFLATLGVKLPNHQGKTLEGWLAEHPGRDDVAAQAIRLRLEYASAAGQKLDAILAAASGTGVVRNTFLYHGAHTGRWSGRGAQLQNLPRADFVGPEGLHVVDVEATLARLTAQIIVQDVSPDARLSIKQQIARSIRGLFVAPEGFAFVAADLSQIESRVLCHLAGQEDKLERYRAGEDIYPATAALLGSIDRNVGKLFDLSGGFGIGGAGLLKKAPDYGVKGLTLEDMNSRVAKWRLANPQIVKFWYDLHDCFRYVVEQPLGINPIALGALAIRRDAEAAYIELPSGRELVYRNPRIEPGKFGKLGVVANLPDKAAWSRSTFGMGSSSRTWCRRSPVTL